MVMAMGVALSGGCGYVPRAPEQSGDAITFIMIDRDTEAMRFALFVLDAKGTLSGSGGMHARNEKIEWTMALGPGDVARLDAAIRDAGWLDGVARGEGDLAAGPRALAVSLRGPQGEQALTIEADGDGFGKETSAVLALLVEFSRRRFDRQLDTLPKAGDSGQGR